MTILSSRFIEFLKELAEDKVDLKMTANPVLGGGLIVMSYVELTSGT